MQFAVDFCHADPSLHPPPRTDLGVGQAPLNWHAMLQEVKSTHRVCDLPFDRAEKEAAEHPSTAPSVGGLGPRDNRESVWGGSTRHRESY
ncbi:hypothetical protein FS749_006431 [Ceratobasidium sp. UAMH 11750]|nr:hypothetical protein FS749_006431 [Ceratobasidium sp. UAMH 11750]